MTYYIFHDLIVVLAVRYGMREYRLLVILLCLFEGVSSSSRCLEGEVYICLLWQSLGLSYYNLVFRLLQC